jgi:hemerythrin
VIPMIKWQDKLNTGVEKIDGQHKHLIEICNEAFALTDLDDGIDHYDEILGILNQLAEYTESHFRFEEALMEKANYPNLEHHKMEHYLFMKKVRKMDLSKIDKNQSQALQDIINMLVDWVSSHILNTDMQYVPYIKEKGL